MSEENLGNTINLGNGVMLNAYPDSIGTHLNDMVTMLKKPEFKDVFSLFYILPTFFNSDLDRGFSIIDYDLNKDLVAEADVKALDKLQIKLKFDIVLNHLSVASPQFQDVLKYGEDSKFKDFFIDWNEFWEGKGELGKDGVIIPKDAYLNKLFMRKSGLPILKVVFPDGKEKPFWNTFYQHIGYRKFSPKDFRDIKGMSHEQATSVSRKLNEAMEEVIDCSTLHLGEGNKFMSEIQQAIHKNRFYLGQMDVNAKSPLVWDFYGETLKKLKGFGCKILRLDAFAYLHKEIGKSNFFNKPGTWEYLERIRQMAQKNNLVVLPEIHAEYGLGLHQEVADKGYYIYDFFLPGLMIHTLENSTNSALLKWVREIITKGYKTVNMLGCHDGIPVLDLKGKEVEGAYNEGLLTDTEIEAIMNNILKRGGRVKNLYDASGKKISYYQVNATFFSALGEDGQKLLMARAIQLFMPGIPQVWYLDIFAGKNDYEAADNGGSGGHKEINRTSLSMQDVESALKKRVVKDQLAMMGLRNTLRAFNGTLKINETAESELDLVWTNDHEWAQLIANLKTLTFNINYTQDGIVKSLIF
jgi:sucrose phosphorylase